MCLCLKMLRVEKILGEDSVKLLKLNKGFLVTKALGNAANGKGICYANTVVL